MYIYIYIYILYMIYEIYCINTVYICIYIYGKPTICTSSSHFATGAQSAAPAPRGRYPIHPTDGGLWKYQRKIVDSTC